MTTIYGFLSLFSVIGGFIFDVLAVLYPPLPLSYFYSVKNYHYLFGNVFQLGLVCRETGQLTSVGWFLYDTFWLKDITEQTLVEILNNL